jgi:aspartate 1-decarboxylase
LEGDKEMRIMKRSKIPNVCITSCNSAYDGSITIGKDLMEKYDILHLEQVHVLGVNLQYGAIGGRNPRTPPRAITYAIEGEGSEVCCNGGLANIFRVGDIVNIVSYEIK